MQTINWLNELCISEITFVNAHTAPAKVYPMRNKGRRHHGFIYTIKGPETYTFDDREIVSSPDSVLYITKNAQYSMQLEGDESIVIFIDFELANASPHPPFLVKFSETDTIKTLFADAEKAWNRKNAGSPSACKSLFFKICESLIKKKESYLCSEGYAKIAESVTYLHAHYLEPDFRIMKLAELSKISAKYYEKLFYQRFGVSPKEYVLSLKIERAKELLLSEKNLVKDVAFQLGYSDIYHFGKIFKARTGYTPREYRNQNM